MIRYKKYVKYQTSEGEERDANTGCEEDQQDRLLIHVKPRYEHGCHEFLLDT